MTRLEECSAKQSHIEAYLFQLGAMLWRPKSTAREAHPEAPQPLQGMHLKLFNVDSVLESLGTSTSRAAAGASTSL